jgi:nitrogen fixation/metabolism regulation signal transduction histidine kinase
MERIDTAIFTFDSQAQLRLINRAGERLLGRPAETLLGKSADRIGMGAWLEGPAVRTVEGQLFHNPGRFSVRRSSFREDGRPHHLVVVTDLRQALREEERQAWQRIIRVLGHELNNSLAPIQSIADSLLSSAKRPGRREDWESDLERGLQVIGSRSAALGRFLDGYRQLARLPAPQPKPVNLAEMLPRVAALETRVPIRLEPGEKTVLQADADQLEQVLINLLRNAADAIGASGNAGEITLSWRREGAQVEILVSDEGPGLANTANLFVPFFTTKPAGSGIGLLLSRQIAEAHGGALTLSNRTDRAGCLARLSLPLEAPPN